MLTSQLKEKFSNYRQQLNIITGDFFDHVGQYDLIIEQTFFCALTPTLRPAYVDRMHKLLKPSGKLVGVLFNTHFEGGPPFGGTLEEYQSLFEHQLNLKTLASCYNSIHPRAGTEAFIIAQKELA
ncbi:hypothetical protein [Paraflavitalea speifideaquila]|uniref:hypothetical protein n=1 Tax=Paraflavitalea speifideaquila TaxID=3076558 RepID=UPI0028EE265A|nr:hypothetical protein [Paraflavitalea speifideiaquila]